MKKVLAMVLATDLPRYNVMTNIIRKTWGSYKSPNFNVLYYYGRKKAGQSQGGQTILEGDNLYCDCNESVDNINLKTVLAFKFVLKHFAFDYVYRSCCGTYIVPKWLLRFLEDKPTDKFYSGIIARLSPDDALWVSGSGYSLSRDLAQLVADNPDTVLRAGAGREDDVCLGRFLAKYDVVPVRAPRIDGSSKLDRAVFQYHVRLVPELMTELHQLVTAAGEDRE